MRKLAAICALLAPFAAQAQVARFELTGPPQSVGEGREFGAAGRYERISGRATVSVDPADPRNAVIADLALAPRNAEGRVEAVADVTILRPADPARGNGTLLLEVPNRGRKLALPLFHESPTAADDRETGNGFLFRQGYTLAWVGWQGDFTPAAGQLGIRVPALAGVTGTVREEMVFDHTRSPAVLPLFYAAAEPAEARLTVRARSDQPRQTPADLSYRLADGPRRVEITGRPPASTPARCTSSPTPRATRWCSASASPRCATWRASCGTSAARPTRSPGRCGAAWVSASRNPGASCATSCISASTRTPRAGRSSRG